MVLIGAVSWAAGATALPQQSTDTTGEQGIVSHAGTGSQQTTGVGSQQVTTGAGQIGWETQAGSGQQTSAHESDEFPRRRLSKPPADAGPMPSITVKQTTRVH
ncbi:hypothetical protein NZK35_13715 [Stieleria sp. ICT_E10.1]|uniref:hypothetical protein n=1 Tax=Stieleria sedimenti TaxID=2976331 RepID=UPI0021808FF5|nr:hypothetical protein [Stieleria sedimenti]MCS7467706.1 hypothetical protein [Stieleria sedimenti]